MDGLLNVSLDAQGNRFGISQHTVDLAKAVYVAISDGQVALPMDQGQAENALMHGYLLPCLDLMCQFPEFIHTAVQYCQKTYGLQISQDTAVCIFEIV